MQEQKGKENVLEILNSKELNRVCLSTLGSNLANRGKKGLKTLLSKYKK